MNNTKTLTLCAAIFASTLVQALPSDTEQPINVSADKAFMNKKSGVATYEGDVIVKQGSIEIEANLLKIFSDPETGELQRLEAEGTPSKFRQQIDESGALIVSEGDTLLYDTTAGKLEVNGNSYLKRDLDEIDAEYILYMLNDETFRAENRGQGRVNMTLQPSTTESNP